MQPRCLQCAAAARLLSSTAARTRCLSTAPPSAFRTLQPYTSPHGRRLFLECAAAAALHAYLPLAAQRSAQPSAALQGASTLTVVLNAMGVDPGRVWKWPWRWYAEAMLLPAPAAAAAAQQQPPPCASLEDMAALARSQGLGARVVRAAGASDGGGGGGGDGAAHPALAELRAAALATSTTPVARHFAVVAYSREGVAGVSAGGGAGGGGAAPHFSLVAGFHAEEDALLLMDVHPARAVPSWVTVGALHGAMLQLRGAGEGGGGFVLLSAPAAAAPPLPHAP